MLNISTEGNTKRTQIPNYPHRGEIEEKHTQGDLIMKETKSMEQKIIHLSIFVEKCTTEISFATHISLPWATTEMSHHQHVPRTS